MPDSASHLVLFQGQYDFRAHGDTGHKHTPQDLQEQEPEQAPEQQLQDVQGSMSKAIGWCSSIDNL